jgi:hypothetical protein
MQITVTPNAASAARIIVRNARIGYADGLNVARIAKTKTPNPNAKPMFSSVFFIPKSDTAAVAAIQAAMWAAVQAKFGQQAEAKWRQIMANNKTPLKDGDLKFNQQGEPMDGFAGNYYIQANAKQDRPPLLLDLYETAPGSGIPAKLERPQNRIYSGCHVNVELNLWGYDNGADGIGGDIVVVQFAADGDQFSGGGAPDMGAFGAVAAPTAQMGFAPAAAPAAPGFAPPAAPTFAAPAAPVAAPAMPAFTMPATPGGVPSPF